MLGMVGIIGFAQTTGQADDDDKKKKKIEKTVEVVNENGELQVTISTIEDGNKTVEVLTGEEAQAWLDKEEAGEGDKEISISISMDDEDMTNAFEFHFSDDMDMEELHKMLSEKFEGMDNVFQFHVDSMMDLSVLKELHNIDIDMDSLQAEIHMRIKEMHEGMPQMTSKMIVITDDEDLSEEEMKELEDMGVSIQVDGKGDNKTVVVARIIRIEDVEPEEDEESLEVESLNLYPNPNSGQFKLKFEVEGNKATTVEVFDTAGKRVFDSKVKGAGKHEIDLDISDNDKGVYILKLTQGKKVSTKKIVVQ